MIKSFIKKKLFEYGKYIRSEYNKACLYEY